MDVNPTAVSVTTTIDRPGAGGFSHADIPPIDDAGRHLADRAPRRHKRLARFEPGALDGFIRQPDRSTL